MTDGTSLTICGAARTVTGSRFLVSAGSEQVLVDCGLFQGRKELRILNREAPPFCPRELAGVVLTHAHIDHTGYLPLLVKQGFYAPIFCTPPTADLLSLVLRDAAHLQEEEAAFANKKGYSKHSPAEPLYSIQDAEKALTLVQPIEDERVTALGACISVIPHVSGHILGSCSLSLNVAGKTLTFSGDIGRYESPLLPDPKPIELGDVLVCESTYGDRKHEQADVEQELANVVNEASAQGGCLLIPAFAIGRTQNLLYYLTKLERERKIPSLPVYVDSPMAIAATKLYMKYKPPEDPAANSFLPKQLHYCSTRDESKALNELKGTRIVIASSGMLTGGRVLHHALRVLPDTNSTLLFVSYQAEGTRGGLIQAGGKEVKMFGTYVPIRANVRSIGGLSAHADRDETVRWLRSCSGSPRLVKVVHGESTAAASLAELIFKELGWKAEVAEQLERIPL